MDIWAAKSRSLLLKRCLFFFVFISTLVVAGFVSPKETNRYPMSPAAIASRIHISPMEQHWLDKQHVVRARVGEFPPFHMWQRGGHGISVEHLRLACQVYAIECQFIQGGAWSQAVSELENANGFDLILTIKKTADRARKVHFTSDYLQLPFVIFSRRNTSHISGVDDLDGKTIAIEQGVVLQHRLAKQYPNITQQPMAGARQALDALSKGRVDAYIGNLTVGAYLLNRWGYSNIQVAAPAPFSEHTLAMAVRPDWPELASLLDRFFRALTPMERAELTNPWLSIRYQYGANWPLVGKVVAAIVMIGTISLLIFGLWNRKLQKEIRKRKQAQQLVMEHNAVLHCLDSLRKQFIKEADPFNLYPPFMKQLQTLAESEYGLVGEILVDEDDGSRYLKIYAMSNLAWSVESKALYAQTKKSGAEFRQMDNLLGQVIMHGEPIIANQGDNQRCISTLLDSRFAFRNYALLPVYFGLMQVGVVGLANRKMDYDDAFQTLLQPVISGLGQVIVARWDREAREKAEKNLRKLATTDSLTGIANRHAFSMRVDLLLANMARDEKNAVLIMFDIDHFKWVNDRNGHDAGDQVLVDLVKLVKTMVREVDLLVRWGGEEFLLLLPRTDIGTGRKIAERIRKQVAEYRYQIEQPVTISIGATAIRPSDTEESMISRVDGALYQAKRCGRNCVVTVD